MTDESFTIESAKPFSESLIWQLNRDYYGAKGIEAWRNGPVPHHLTSNSYVGKTYAELIFAFLKDLAYKGQKQRVYILELGAGHGRLGFHILKHLERLNEQLGLDLPPYCYILSDISEKSLQFFQQHPQFQPYFEKGVLDVAYYDAIGGNEISLRHSGQTISTQDLHQPLLVLANYFFDSLPKDLFSIKNNKIEECRIALNAQVDTQDMDAETLFKNIEVNYSNHSIEGAFYEDPIFNEIVKEYGDLLFNTYLLFPNKGLQCIRNLQKLSKKGLMIISMDKGYHEIHDLENAKPPEMIRHGSVSFYVNYHAILTYCKKMKGITYFPTYSTFHLELGCMLFLSEGESYHETKAAYHRVVDEFGPDDFNTNKEFHYRQISKVGFSDLIALLRLSAYDSTLFKKVLPKLKQTASRISFNDRTRLAQTMHEVWNMYFLIEETDDLAFEIAGLLYSLGYYQDALRYFQFSIAHFGHSADGFYNRVLCHYQLRQDDLFVKTLKEAKATFPTYEKYTHLDKLDLNAE